MRKHSVGYYIAMCAIYLACLVTIVLTVLICIGCFQRIAAGNFTNPFDKYTLNFWDIEFWKSLFNFQKL